MDNDGMWQSYKYYNIKLCTICAFKKQPVLYLKGFCNAAPLDWVYYPENEGNTIMYNGYKESLITFANYTWTVDNRVGDTTLNFFLKDMKHEYPVGRKEWQFGNTHLEGCPDINSSISQIFSPCVLGEEFSCSNGLCVSLDKRCNHKNDCFDQTDEDYCYYFKTENAYNRLSPPEHIMLDSEQKAAQIGVAIEIGSVEKVDVDTGKIYLSYRLTLSWVENRLSYFNLAKNKTNDFIFKELPSTILSELWDPITILYHVNGDIGSIFMDPLSKSLQVKIKNNPIRINGEWGLETLEYPGHLGVLLQHISMKGVYDCSYDLFRFPFDHQECTVQLELKSSQDIRIIPDFKNISVSFYGTRYLTEFEILDSFPYMAQCGDRTEFGFVLKIKHIYQKQITALYFQTFLLWIVSYLTLLIDVNDFSNRFIGAVTSLLVLSSLMDNINSRLPASPHMKLIDIWNIWNVIQIVGLIMVHILVNKLLNTKYPKNKNLLLHPSNLNTMAKFGFPVVHVGFIVYYVSHNFVYKETISSPCQ